MGDRYDSHRPVRPQRGAHYDTDVAIVGGGPAGLAAAIAAAGHGLSVTVLDAAGPAIDKACGEGLMPDAIAALQTLGVSLDGLPCHPFTGIRFLGAGHCAEAAFPAGSGKGMRRTVLQERLRQRASELGVCFAWNTRVIGLEGDCLQLDGRSFRARWIVGADGLQSRTRRWAGLDRGRILSRRSALRHHYRVPPWSGFVEVYWSSAGQAYVTPVSPEMVCVAFVARDRQPNAAHLLDCIPELQARLAGALPSGRPRGAVTIGRRLARCATRHVALVGDAAGSVDAVTGEGMLLGFRQAVALADAMAAGDLSGYAAACTAIRRVPLFMSQTLLLMDRSPLVRCHTLRVLERSPHLFSRMMRVHLGDAPLRWWGEAGVLDLGWRMLTT